MTSPPDVSRSIVTPRLAAGTNILHTKSIGRIRRRGYTTGMAWIFLLVAGACEIVWAAGLKAWGFNLTRGGIFTIVMMILSFVLLSRAMKELPLGTSYAIWTGIGAVGTAIWGMVHYNEPKDVPRIICIGLIVAGIVGLKLLLPAQRE
jgi:quaternary ammonium compound-resistance protein SugE